MKQNGYRSPAIYRKPADQIKHLTQIGMALSGEKNLDRLLEMIVDEARKFTNADAGTLYIMSDDETELNFAIVQNNSLDVRMGGTGGKITWPPVKLINTDGSPNTCQCFRLCGNFRRDGKY